MMAWRLGSQGRQRAEMQTPDLYVPNIPSRISAEYITMKQQFYLGGPRGTNLPCC
jgi:hypothetical protein